VSTTVAPIVLSSAGSAYQSKVFRFAKLTERS